MGRVTSASVVDEELVSSFSVVDSEVSVVSKIGVEPLVGTLDGPSDSISISSLASERIVEEIGNSVVISMLAIVEVPDWAELSVRPTIVEF